MPVQRRSLRMQENTQAKRCEQQGCRTIASYNFPGRRNPVFCKKHALPGMVRHSQTVRLARHFTRCSYRRPARSGALGRCPSRQCAKACCAISMLPTMTRIAGLAGALLLSDAKSIAVTQEQPLASQAAGECGVTCMSSHGLAHTALLA